MKKTSSINGLFLFRKGKKFLHLFQLFLNFRQLVLVFPTLVLYLFLLEGFANMNILLSVIKLFSLRKFQIQTAITGAFPISFKVSV